MSDRKRICQMCGVEFEVPESWENDDCTIIQEVSSVEYRMATICEECTPKYFLRHRARKTTGCFRVFKKEDSK